MIFGRKKKRESIEERIKKLATVGIQLAPERSIDELLESWSREELETGSYFDLVVALGFQVESGMSAGAYFTDQVFTLDAECIEDRGDYVRVFRGLERLFQGEMPLVDLEDEVEIEETHARVAFKAHGESFEKSFEQVDDWLSDCSIDLWAHAVETIRQQYPDRITRRMSHFSDGGQGIVFVCLRPDEFKRFRKLTGIQAQLFC